MDGGKGGIIRAFISIGSNSGDRPANCKRAVELLGEEPLKVRLVAQSSLYETAPWGVTGQAHFVNMAVEVETALAPRELLRYLKAIEERLGRQPGGRWGPRVIDLDIVYYGDAVVDEEGLTIPHSHCHERAFVLIPLADIAPGFVHPVLKKSTLELLALLGDGGGVRRLDAGAA